MDVRKNEILTVKTADGDRFEAACNDLISAGFVLKFSGHNGTEWWAILAKQTATKRKSGEVAK